ncbi:MAG TPA: ABC transporter ATP-binding protein [Nocardioides sp.]|nr:ABC transporter ATP-binding protein [Nocardioides sp.]
MRSYWRAAVEACGRGRLIRLQIADVIGALSEALVLALLIPLVRVLAGAGTTDLPGLGWHLTATRSTVALLGAVAVRALTQWYSTVAASSIKLATTNHLRLRALNNVLRSDWHHLAQQRRSDIVQATTTEIERADAALGLLLRLGVQTLMTAATALVGLAISPLLGGVAITALLLVVAVTRRSVRNTLHLGLEWNRRNAIFGATVTDSLSSLRLIRAHDAAEEWAGMLREAADAGRQIEKRYVEIGAGLQAALGIAGVVAAVALVLIGHRLGLGVAPLLALAVVTSRLLASARSLLQSVQAFAQLAPALEGIERISREAAAHVDPATGSPTPPSPGPPPVIELRSLAAGYGPEPAVRDLSLVIDPGSFVVVSGPSGAGKSTLLDVLLCLLTPSEGAFLVDGAPVTDVTAWRSQIGYVPQQTVLVPATVRRNLTWSTHAPTTDAQLWAALEDAHVAGAVRALPDGLDTELQDFTQLSGGEQQRLCIARALVRSPRVLVLDEATGALDIATEIAVLERLRSRGCTIVMATHRPGVIEAAQQRIELFP